jgi:PAS domain S-box-containing protein
MFNSLVKASEEKFAATFNQAAVGIAHVGLDGTWLLMNDKLCGIIGYEREELLHQKFQDVTHPEDLEKDLGLVHQVIAGELPTYSMEKRYIHKNGSIVWANLTVSIVRTGPIEQHYFISVVEDITARKKVEEDMVAVQRQLKLLLDERTQEKDDARQEFLSFFMMSKDIMAVFNSNGYARRINRATVELLGYSEEELLTRRWLTFIHPDDLASSNQAIEKFFAGNDPVLLVENRYICKDGSIRHISWSVTHIGESGLRFVLGRDCTDERRKEKLVSEEKLRLASVSKINSLGRMAANIAHEINNPLTVIYGQACQLNEMCSGETLNKVKVKKISEDLTEMSSRIATIIRSLRLFAREGSQDPKEPKFICDIVEDAISLCKNQLRMGGVDLESVDIAPAISVDCRPVQISQVLLNLINNAFDAVQDEVKKKIWVRAEIVGAFCQIMVLDSGPGVDEAVRTNLFQPFFTTKPLGKGTGLGLNISKQIIEAHGGKLFYQPYEGRSCFVVELPISKIGAARSSAVAKLSSQL